MDDIRALVELKQYKQGKFEYKTDIVARESSLHVYINENRLISLASLSQKMRELAYGFLFSEGLVLNINEIINDDFNFNEKYINFTLDIPGERISSFLNSGEKTSGCGSTLSGKLETEQRAFPKFSIDPQNILRKMGDFIGSSQLFRQTGGVHIAGLLIENELRYFAEDIGRHNAIDKVAGEAILANDTIDNSILLCSGRISSEIVKKAVRLHIPLIVSKSAPTSQAIRLGWKYGTYLIGFTRGQRFNIYTGFDDLYIK